MTRRISLALLVGSLLKAMAAECEALPMGPWDLKAQPTGGRLANHLALAGWKFSALCLKGVEERKYRKNKETLHINELASQEAA